MCARSDVYVDGRKARNRAFHGDVVCVQAAPKPATLLHPRGYRYFSMLRQKLRWTERAS